MPWTTSVSELRTLLSDGPTDRYVYRKRCFGQIDGVNVNFKTFEFRRVTDLTTASAPLGVFVNGSAVTVASDDLSTGEFVLAAAPVDGDVVEATYYGNLFLDTEMGVFLLNAARWLGAADATTIADGLIPAALKYAASEAFEKLGMKYIQKASETFLLEDMPEADRITASKNYQEIAERYKEQATKARDEYYTRQGQSLQPLFGVAIGAVRSMP